MTAKDEQFVRDWFGITPEDEITLSYAEIARRIRQKTIVPLGRTAEQFASEWLDRGHSVEKRSELVRIIQQAMAQAHAAGREVMREDAAQTVLHQIWRSCPCGRISEPEAECLASHIRALRTASAQPESDATEGR